MSEEKKIDPKQEVYVLSLVDFVNRLGLTKENKLKFIEEMIKNKETAFVNKKDELECKNDKGVMPLFKTEDGKEIHADEKTLYQSVGDEDEDKKEE